jgi:hypothetical protein
VAKILNRGIKYRSANKDGFLPIKATKNNYFCKQTAHKEHPFAKLLLNLNL